MDATVNATLTTDAAGNTTATTDDADNRAVEVKQTSGPNATPASSEVQDTQTGYDADGQTSSSTVYDFAHGGANSQTTTSTYDAAGRPATQTDPSGLVTTTTYDALGNVTDTKQSFTLGGSQFTLSDTTASFDHLGRMLSKVENPTIAGGQTTTYTYDADGRQLSLKDTAGHTTSSSYDPLGRVVTVTHPDATQDTTTYDAAGQRLTQHNASGTTTDSYDALGRVSSEQQSDGTGTLQSTVTYTYDANGNKLSQTTTPAGGSPATTTWSYDKLNRPAGMSDGTRSYTYDALGNVTGMQVFNGGTQTVQSQYAYDGANRLSSLTDYVGPGTSNPLHGYSYTYDAAGNRSSVTEDGTTSTYSYDGENQLLSVTSGGTTQASYTYDANHNRTKLVTPSGTTTYTYDSSATDTLLQQKTDPNGKITTYAYDANGNLTTATYDPTGANQVTTYKYDPSNRLTEIDEPTGTTVSFTYDANGQRNQKTVQTGGSNPTMTVVTDHYQNGRLAYQTDQGGTVLATFTYDPNGVPESVVVGPDPVNGPRYYYVYNGHGDVVALTDASDNVVASYRYDVWGNLTSATENIPNANGWVNSYRYDGRDGARYDVETGLYWLSTRAYDPTLGRFLQRDPLGRMPLFFWDQPYAYAGNNPLVNVDPSGQRYTDALVGPETAKQQIAQARRTQQVARVMPRQPAPPKKGGGSGCGGCNARANRTTPQAPSCDKVCQARQIAGGFAKKMEDILVLLTLGGANWEKIPLLAKLKGLLGGWLSRIPFFGGFLATAEKAIGEILTAIAAEAFMLWAFFTWQANYEPDGWLTNQAVFAGSVYTVTTILISGSVLVGAGVAALTDAVGGGPEDPVGDVLAAIFGILGMGGSATFFGLGAMGTLESERKVLWG